MTNLIRKKTFDEKLSEIGKSYNNQNYNLVKKVSNNSKKKILKRIFLKRIFLKRIFLKRLFLKKILRKILRKILKKILKL